MAFTITCDACGTAQKFTAASSINEENIAFDIHMSGHYQQIPEDMTIYCGNPTCNKSTTIRC